MAGVSLHGASLLQSGSHSVSLNFSLYFLTSISLSLFLSSHTLKNTFLLPTPLSQTEDTLMEEDDSSTTLASARKRGRGAYTLGEDMDESEDSTTLSNVLPTTPTNPIPPVSKKGRFGGINAPSTRISRWVFGYDVGCQLLISKAA